METQKRTREQWERWMQTGIHSLHLTNTEAMERTRSRYWKCPAGYFSEKIAPHKDIEAMDNLLWIEYILHLDLHTPIFALRNAISKKFAHTEKWWMEYRYQILNRYECWIHRAFLLPIRYFYQSYTHKLGEVMSPRPQILTKIVPFNRTELKSALFGVKLKCFPRKKRDPKTFKGVNLSVLRDLWKWRFLGND